jgi:hypothetical protein
MCAGSARGLGVAITLVVAILASNSFSSSGSGRIRGFGPQDAGLLRQHRDVARAAKGAGGEAAWYAYARFALEHAHSVDAPGSPDAPEIAEALRDACRHLPPGSLAALAALGAHPTVSAAYCDAIARHGGPKGVPGPSEIAAEARDALVAFGGTRGKSLLDLVKRGDAPAAGAGGAQRSVYSVRIVGPRVAYAAGETWPIREGIRLGVAAAAGAWADRFQVYPDLWPDEEVGSSFMAARTARAGGTGVIVVTDGSAPMIAATTAGLTSGVVVVDARSHGPTNQTPGDSSLTAPEAELYPPLFGRFLLLPFSDRLAYLQAPSVAGASVPALVLQGRPFVLRPTAVERGRRLAQALSGRDEVRVVAVALPEAGGDFDMAAGFVAAMRATKREVKVLTYAPGRRDYQPEARRFAATGAQAILFAGPSEESAEWLTALTRLRQSPLVLGTSELDPAGHHASVRSRLESAIYVGDDWSDRDVDLVGRMTFAGDSLGIAEDPEFRRGFRFGWMMARAVIEGAWTPASLRIALEQRSLPSFLGQSSLSPVTSRAMATTIPTDVVVPLFIVRKGVVEPFEPR